LAEKPGKLIPFEKKHIAKGPQFASNIDISASSATRHTALGEDNLRTAISRILFCGTIRETWHSEQERSYRNVSQDDIVAMLDGPWKLVARPEWSHAHENWKYKLIGMDIEGDELELVVAVNTELDLIEIITKY